MKKSKMRRRHQRFGGKHEEHISGNNKHIITKLEFFSRLEVAELIRQQWVKQNYGLHTNHLWENNAENKFTINNISDCIFERVFLNI